MAIAVMAAGGIGVGLRYAVDQAVPRSAGSIPWTTFGVNVAGALALGLLVALAGALASDDTERTLRMVVGLGLLGGFTTFSTYAMEAVTLADDGHVARAVGYVSLTTVTGIGAAAIGLLLGRSFTA